MEQKHILVIDDKADMRMLLNKYLIEQGFTVETVVEGEAGLYAARRRQPDLILLDLMMPKMDGYQFLRHYRRDHQTPVIVMTSKDDEADTVLALELGADDYVTKPVRLRELVSRIRAVLRRGDVSTGPAGRVRQGGLVLDRHTHTVTLDNEPVELTVTEFKLLDLFMNAPGQVFTREMLVKQLAAVGYTGSERTLNVHVRNLRQKIEADPTDPQYIETVFGVGYRFGVQDG